MANSRVLAGLVALAAVMTAGAAAAQTEFWREEFDNGCTALCPGSSYVGPNGPWTVTDVTPPGSSANTWYVSCSENGEPAGSCGTDCGSNATLHVGNVSTSPAAFLFCPTGDCGAAYDTSGATVVANKRIVSPAIDATGKFGLTVSFKMLGQGEPCDDAADLELSLDGGLSWSTLSACLTSDNASCLPQGQWTEQVVALPAAADDAAALQLAFRWQNDGDFVGQDPSFAVDDVSLRHGGCVVGPLPHDLGNDLRMVQVVDRAVLDWTSMGAPAATTTHFHVYRSDAKGQPFPAGWLLLAGDSPRLTLQGYSDQVVLDAASYYYDVRSADDCENLSP